MKKKRFKTLRIVLIVFIFLIIAAVASLSLFANKALKAAIETAGIKALKVNVNLDKAALSIPNGSISLYNLMIDNPEGYQHKKFLELKQANIKVDIKSLLTEIVDIESIKLDGAKVVFEQKQ